MSPVAVSVPPGVPFDPAPLAGLGLAPTLFPADGTGGRELEAAVKAGQFAGVLELCLAELAAELFRASGTAGPDRLTAAALAGVPQVITPGLTGWAELRPRDADRVGLDIAQRACAAKGPTAILLPLRGQSGTPTDAEETLFQSIRNWVFGVELVELDLAADDPAFVRAAAERLAAMLAR